jgi:sodium transport system permease protein
MRGALLILKKEFMEFSKDRKTMFFTLVMPMFLFPLIMTMMNTLSKNDSAKQKGKPSRVAIVDPDHLLTPILKADTQKFDLVPLPEGDFKEAIRKEKLELVVEVEAGAADKLARQETIKVTATRDESERSSELGLKRFREALKVHDESLVAGRLKALNAPIQLAVPTKVESVNASDDGRSVSKAVGAFLPYMVMMMMFAGSLQHGIYATAGEKERGTLLTLLSTSLPRSQIILGKLLYIFSIGVLVALINLLSMGLSITNMISQDPAKSGAQGAAAASSLGPLSDPLILLLVFMLMVPLGLLFSNLILFMGIRAKNTVEAGSSLMPLMMVVIFMGMFSAAPGVEKMTLLPYIPVLNVSLAIRKLFSQQGSTLEYLVALFMTIGLAGVMTWVSTRIINRESAIFKA